MSYYIIVHLNQIPPTDLLEKSRVINQQPGERCYHIFYQLIAGASNDLLNTLLLSRQVKSYRFLENGEVSVDDIDDSVEFTSTMVCNQLVVLANTVCISGCTANPTHAHFTRVLCGLLSRMPWLLLALMKRTKLACLKLWPESSILETLRWSSVRGKSGPAFPRQQVCPSLRLLRKCRAAT